MDELKYQKLDELIGECRSQTNRFLQHQANDPRYCFEIWRRAVVEQDQVAWQALTEQYSGLVRNWLGQRLARYPALQFEQDILVNGVFIKFYRYVGAEKFSNFQNLNGVLKYLKLCCGTMVSDANRDYQARRLDTSLEGNPSPSEQAETGLTQTEQLKSPLDLEESLLAWEERERFWAELQAKIPDATDQILIYLRFIQNMKPSEIVQQYPHQFNNVEQVYLRLKNIMHRLRGV